MFESFCIFTILSQPPGEGGKHSTIANGGDDQVDIIESININIVNIIECININIVNIINNININISILSISLIMSTCHQYCRYY